MKKLCKASSTCQVLVPGLAEPCLLCSYLSGSKLQVGSFRILLDNSSFSIEKIFSNIRIIFVDTSSIKLQYSSKIGSKLLDHG